MTNYFSGYSGKISNSANCHNWDEYKKGTNGIMGYPALNAFETKMGVPTPSQRHKLPTYVNTYLDDHPNAHKPTIRTVAKLGGNPHYKESSEIKLGVRTSSTDTGDYIGMNFNIDGACYNPIDNQVLLVFKGDVIQYIKDKVLIDTKSRIAVFPEIGTNSIDSVYRSNAMDANNYWRLYFYDNTGMLYYYEVDNSSSTGYKHLGTVLQSWQEMRTARGADWTLWFKNDTTTTPAIQKVDVVGNTGNFVPYGAGTGIYEGLPNDVPVDACWNDKVNGIVYVSIGETIYLLDTLATVVASSFAYNQPPATLIEHKWTNPNQPFQINLERCGDNTIWDSRDKPTAPSIQYWNGNRKSTATGIMTNGNWVDGEVYTFSYDKLATEMLIYTYGGSSVIEQGTNWKVEGWGQTILRGNIVQKDGRTYFVIKKGSTGDAKGIAQYRSFDVAMNANPQEQMGGSVNCEVQQYIFCDTIDKFEENSLLIPDILNDFQVETYFN